MEDVKFGWDPKKHDEKIPDKPQIFEIPCPDCEVKGFMVSLTKIVCQHVKSTDKTMVGLQPSGFVLCTKCSEVFNMEKIANAAREGLHRQAPPGFEKTS